LRLYLSLLTIFCICYSDLVEWTSLFIVPTFHFPYTRLSSVTGNRVFPLTPCLCLNWVSALMLSLEKETVIKQSYRRPTIPFLLIYCFFDELLARLWYGCYGCQATRHVIPLVLEPTQDTLLHHLEELQMAHHQAYCHYHFCRLLRFVRLQLSTGVR